MVVDQSGVKIYSLSTKGAYSNSLAATVGEMMRRDLVHKPRHPGSRPIGAVHG